MVSESSNSQANPNGETSPTSKSPVENVSGAHWIELVNGRSVVFTKLPRTRTTLSSRSRINRTPYLPGVLSPPATSNSLSKDSAKKRKLKSGTSIVGNTVRNWAVPTITPLFLAIVFLTGNCSRKNPSDGTARQSLNLSGPMDSRPWQTLRVLPLPTSPDIP